jgi:hypothetical protein
MSQLTFIACSVEREREIDEMVKNNLAFFEQNRIIFTKSEKSVAEGYDFEKYARYQERIEMEWDQKSGAFFQKLSDFFRLSNDLTFKVEISNYGPLGFYHTHGNVVTINMNADGRQDFAGLIKHEMIHIVIDPFIKKYSIDHPQKEK